MVVVLLLLTGCLGGNSKEYSISGVVQDGLGIPLARVELSLEGDEIAPRVIGPTGADGRWSAHGLKGRVNLEVVDKEGWYFNPKSQVFHRAADEVVITAVRGEPLTIHIVGDGEVEQEVLFTPLSTEYYPRTTRIRLKAVPAPDWRFNGWVGVPEDVDPENPVIEITVDEPVELWAEFLPTITVSVGVEFLHTFPKAYEQLVEEGQVSLGPSSQAWAQPQAASAAAWAASPVEGEFIALLDRSLSREEQVHRLEEDGYTVLDTIEILGAHLVRPADSQLGVLSQEGHLRALESVAGVLAVEPNLPRVAQAFRVPDDPHYAGHQWWHYEQIRLPQAWAVTTGDRSVRVAVLDSGVDTDHPDLVGQLDLEYAWNFTWEDSIEDLDGHGTHVTGTIGAKTNNGLGVGGVMWEVEILPAKVLAADEGSSWSVAQGILYAAGALNDQEDKPTNPRPADIINMSLGGPYSILEEQAVQEAHARGVIMVAATGNDGWPVIDYPAGLPEVIAVSATGSGLDLLPGPYEPPLAEYSNFGTGDFVVAPGGGGVPDILDYVLSTFPDGKYAGYYGASMAAPHVTGVIGLMLANGIPKSEVREVLERTCMKIHNRNSYFYGHGLVNAYWAVNGVEHIRLIQGLRSGTEIQAVVEELVPLPGDQWTMELVAGEYQLIAWVDVNGNDILDVGDYYSESEVLEFDHGDGWIWAPVLKEVHPVDLPDSAAGQAALGSMGHYQLIKQ